ncbi:uncharacterized protein LOC119195510 isoform X2 [Pungitius pungitius]|uniref:uncharacterized protein LOC119195510 isoform X2 n=1 Tax=Pungitius pungitius TaxID=134920 RepID=UPI002E0FA21E
MQQDCITDLYRSLGKSVGAEFSSEDVSVLYHKVFHVSSDTNEAYLAMKKIAGGDDSWSCVGENVLDVLLEMEREKEKKEKFHWDLQLLNVGNLNTLRVTDKQVRVDPHVLNRLHQSTDPITLPHLVGGGELRGSARVVKRLKKAARQCWARLASESVQSLLPSPWQGQSLGVRGHAWGCVSLSDVLLLLDVKYDAVTHLLFTEMLQEHYTLRIWETLPPWQQHKEEEGLGDLADEALESGDMLRLAELPGALRIYRASVSPECREQCWSAVSLLYELFTFHQQERDALIVLGERLDRGSLRLLCLHIRLATLRAQREEMSYSALLAARQSWETWPHIKGPCRAEQAALWLHSEERKKDFISVSPQQAVLQLLVLTQEQERKHLVKLANGISIEDLEEPGSTLPLKEDSHQQDALRNGCIKRLGELRADLLMRNNTQTTLEQTHCQPQLQPNTSSQPTGWCQHHLEDCSLLLLTHLMEFQDVQASALLPALMDKSAQCVQALREAYESELQAPCYTNLLQLISNAPFTSGSVLPHYTDLTEKSKDEQITALSFCSGAVDDHHSSGEPAEAPMGDPEGELNVTRAAERTDKEDICKGAASRGKPGPNPCSRNYNMPPPQPLQDRGAVTEDLPYLEILRVSDATRQSLDAGRETHDEREVGSATKLPRSYEKQGSLITLAWSKPAEDDTEGGEGAAGESKEVQPKDRSSTAEHTTWEGTTGVRDGEEMKPSPLHSDSTRHPVAHSAEQQCSTGGQRALAEQPEMGEPKCILQTRALVAETLQAAEAHCLVDPPEIERDGGDICSELMKRTANVDREVLEVERCPTAAESELWDMRGPETPYPEDQKYTQAAFDSSPPRREATRDPTLMERERAREPVSEMEREITMRNLVDTQRKVEQRQQRDKERQLLRVQERLSIMQNRIAEEGLLGLKHIDRLRHLTKDLPQEDKNQQKTVVRERLDQLRRERSYVMQSKRERNTAGFKELLGPVALNSNETDEGED